MQNYMQTNSEFKERTFNSSAFSADRQVVPASVVLYGGKMERGEGEGCLTVGRWKGGGYLTAGRWNGGEGGASW